MTNIEKMTRFLNEVQSICEKNNWSYVQPRVSSTVDENGEPDDRLIDAHWKQPSFEMLLAVDDGGFAFYGDNFGPVKVSHASPKPQDVAEALNKLQSVGASS